MHEHTSTLSSAFWRDSICLQMTDWIGYFHLLEESSWWWYCFSKSSINTLTPMHVFAAQHIPFDITSHSPTTNASPTLEVSWHTSSCLPCTLSHEHLFINNPHLLFSTLTHTFPHFNALHIPHPLIYLDTHYPSCHTLYLLYSSA